MGASVARPLAANCCCRLFGKRKRGRPSYSSFPPMAAAVLLAFGYYRFSVGSPLALPAQFWIQGPSEVIVFELPAVTKLIDMLFMPWRGLLFYYPFRFFRFPGYWSLYRKCRDGSTDCSSTIFMVFFFAASFLVYFAFLLVKVG